MGIILDELEANHCLCGIGLPDTENLFKNAIINGDFSVNQRGVNSLENGSGYIVDRVFAVANDSKLDVGVKNTIAGDGGEESTVSNPDPFGDSSGVALYEFEDNADDTGGNHNGTWSGTEQYDDGKFGKGAKFDGENSVIDLDNVSIPENYSFSFWVKTTSTENNGLIRFGRTDDDNTAHCVMLRHKSDGYMEFKQIDGSADWFTTTDDINSGEFEFIAVVQNGANVKIYKNNTIILDEDIGEHTGNSDPADCAIGESVDDDYYFEGVIDQVRIFDRALTEEEITTLYNEVIETQIPVNPYLQLTLNTKGDSAEIYPYIYKFEGQHISHLTKDNMALSFDFISSKSDTYNIKFKVYFTDGTNQEYATIFKYNQDDCKDFCRVKISIPKFDNTVIMDETLGAELYICNNLESQFSENDYIKITNIQLEAGESATSFEKVPKEIQLLRCKRYYRKGASDTYDSETDIFPMRTAPTITGNESPYIYDAEL